MTILLSDIYNVTLKRGNRGANSNGWIRPTVGETYMTHRDFKYIVNRIEVGAGKTYSTIIDAVNAAEDDDTIYIYPGTYEWADTSGTVLNKRLNFKGLYDGVWDGNPQVTINVNNVFVYGGDTTVTSTPLYVEGIEFRQAVTTSWKKLFGSNIRGWQTIMVNRCSFITKAMNQYSIYKATDDTMIATGYNSRLKIKNCYLTGYPNQVVFLNGYTDRDTIEKCTTNTAFSALYCRNEVVFDCINGSSVGYGPAYGEWLLT